MNVAVELAWKQAHFDALSVRELYALLQLRSAVFVVEQDCLFQDMDNSDAQAIHLMAWDSGQLLAYARCYGPGIKFREASIGRIATHMAARGTGLGQLLVQKAIDLVSATWGPQPIRIGAQARLKKFYQGIGFDDMGIPYVEDGIDHLEMVWHPATQEMTRHAE
jgi:ElaA protein